MLFTRSGGRPDSLTATKDAEKVAWANWNSEIRIWAGDSRKPRILKANALLGRAAFSATLDRAIYTTGRKLITLDTNTGKSLSVISCEASP